MYSENAMPCSVTVTLEALTVPGFIPMSEKLVSAGTSFGFLLLGTNVFLNLYVF